MAEIQITEQFTMSELPELTKEVNEIVTQQDDIVFNLININNIDISAIQYLIAVDNKQKQNNKTLTINIECNELSKQLIVNSGFGPLFKL